MSWIIPECKLDDITTQTIDYPVKNGNLCISGFINTGKTVVLMYILRKLIQNVASKGVVLLVYRNIDIDKYKALLRELSIDPVVMTYWHFRQSSSKYDYILCEDIQLISADLLCDIKSRGNHVVVTINPQLLLFENSIFTQTRTLTLEQVRDILNPKVYVLRYNYLYNSVIEELSHLLLNVDISAPMPSISHDLHSISLCKASNNEEEMRFVIEKAERFINHGYSVAVLIPTNKKLIEFVQSVFLFKKEKKWKETSTRWGTLDFDNLNQYLSEVNLNYQCLGSHFGKYSKIDNRINILTYHASMGLIFDFVFMPFVNSDQYISPNELINRNAFVLASTRSRIGLYYTYNGSKHHYLNLIEDNCEKIIIKYENYDNNLNN